MTLVPAHFMPFPELVERRPGPRPYFIGDTSDKAWLPTNGFTSLAQRVLCVPLTPEGRGVALHELAHVFWSPKNVPRDLGFDPQVLIAVEDARVNMGLAHCGLPMVLSEAERARVAELARGDWTRALPLAFVLRAVASLGTNGRRDVLEALRAQPAPLRRLVLKHVRRVHGALIEGRRRARRPVAAAGLVRRLAEELVRDLERELPPLGYSAALPDGPKLVVGCGLGCAHAGRPRGPGGLEHARRSLRQGRSGQLRIATPPLEVPHAGRGHGRLAPGGATREGVIPHHPHRRYLDGAIFRYRARRPGGTVLIDVSGSMSLDAASIDRVLAASAGAARVAVYSGEGDVGELRLVARDGQRAAARHLAPFGKGNIVDEPALAWLASQPGPRLWISDGGVTGVDDVPSKAIHDRCRAVCRRAHIRRVETIDEAVRMLGGRD